MAKRTKPAPPRIRTWALGLAGGLAASESTLLLPPHLFGAPIWAYLILYGLRFLVLWFLSYVMVICVLGFLILLESRYT